MEVDKLKGSHHFESVDYVEVLDSNGTKYAVGYDEYDYFSIEKGEIHENEDGETVFYSEKTTGINLSQSAIQALKDLL